MGSERRRAERLECCLPVRLKGAGRPLIAETSDLSRVGLMIRLSLAELGVEPETGAQGVVREVNRRLGEVAVAELHYEVLGALVRKGLRVVRISVPPDDQEYIDLGCEFRAVLTPDEVSFLGLALPEIVEGAEVPDEEAAEIPLCAYLGHGDDHADVVPILATVVSQSEAGFVVRIADPSILPVLPHREDVGAGFEAVTDAFGSRPRLLIVHGVKPIWCGSARVQAVGRVTQLGGFDVQFVFEPPLSAAARTRLGALQKRTPESRPDPVQTPPTAAAPLE